MTYDVLRYMPHTLYGEFAGMVIDPDGRYVLAADAEAHEKAEIERVTASAVVPDFVVMARQHREQAIRDCIAVVEAHKHKAESWRQSDQPDDDYYKALTHVTTTLRALLEGEK